VVIPTEGSLLRIFIGDGDRHEGRPLYEWLVLRARAEGVAGATVLRGAMGYGASSRVHTFKIERLSEDLPVVLEFVDSREKLERFLAVVDGVVTEGLATLEKAEVRFYRTGQR
jgi:uncharacterized protein